MYLLDPKDQILHHLAKCDDETGSHQKPSPSNRVRPFGCNSHVPGHSAFEEVWRRGMNKYRSIICNIT